ncbi:hypothetical protein Pmani_008626 [Petrolisthes manimaculis]|uniref:Uncharacterized protein n=1 Tax=Petrolisthes manimaculis TaxID=1843537 RepID=A0AAE1UDP5_9EUCA|nr:hypothetical protein Pmani_008626 [Petrolisthes manimaculis]
MSDQVRCLACDNVVADHHQAIDCDSCGGWQHRGCETGLSRYKYNKLRSGIITFDFICNRCKFLSSQSSLSLPMPIMESTPMFNSTWMESEDINPAAAHTVADEEFTSTCGESEDITTAAPHTETRDLSNFDVSRPHRSLVADEELSLSDDNLSGADNLPTQSATTFTIVESAAPNVSSFVIDFEAGLWKALRSVFDDPVIYGCAFHFGQALWRKVQELGLQTSYSKRDSVYKLVRKVFALPFLPHDDIKETFDELSCKVGVIGPVREFMDYVDQTWLQSPVWKTENWSVFGRSIRTNNDVEGWHHKLNRRAKKGNLPFYLLISLLYSEANEIPNQVQLVKEGKLKRYQRKQVRKLQGRLMKQWEDYNEKKITTGQLLKKCSGIYAPV